ncbi:MAG: hypothetical protein ACE361_21715 [Aureliella sp.]
MKSNPRALIVDDDSDASALLQHRLRRVFPDLQIETRTEPDVTGEFDVYFLDNDFGGVSEAGRLTEAIRSEQPGALVIAFSACLDNRTLRQLVNAECNRVFEKDGDGEFDRLLEIVRHYIQSHHGVSRRAVKSIGLTETISSIADLLREWNRRLDSQSRANQNDAAERTQEVA